jgi:hypothetical protein
MSVEATINGYSLVGKPAAFAVHISSGGSIHERIVPLTTKSRYQAELAAIKYVCAALPNKDIRLVVKTSDAHLSSIFTKKKDGSWIKRKRPNKMVDDVRELSEQFESFECTLDSDSELMAKIKGMAKRPSSI